MAVNLHVDSPSHFFCVWHETVSSWNLRQQGGSSCYFFGNHTNVTPLPSTLRTMWDSALIMSFYSLFLMLWHLGALMTLEGLPLPGLANSSTVNHSPGSLSLWCKLASPQPRCPTASFMDSCSLGHDPAARTTPGQRDTVPVCQSPLTWFWVANPMVAYSLSHPFFLLENHNKSSYSQFSPLLDQPWYSICLSLTYFTKYDNL